MIALLGRPDPATTQAIQFARGILEGSATAFLRGRRQSDPQPLRALKQRPAEFPRPVSRRHEPARSVASALREQPADCPAQRRARSMRIAKEAASTVPSPNNAASPT